MPRGISDSLPPTSHDEASLVEAMETYTFDERYETRDVVSCVGGGVDIDLGLAVEESVLALLVGRCRQGAIVVVGHALYFDHGTRL